MGNCCVVNLANLCQGEGRVGEALGRDEGGL